MLWVPSSWVKRWPFRYLQCQSWFHTSCNVQQWFSVPFVFNIYRGKILWGKIDTSIKRTKLHRWGGHCVKISDAHTGCNPGQSLVSEESQKLQVCLHSLHMTDPLVEGWPGEKEQTKQTAWHLGNLVPWLSLGARTVEWDKFGSLRNWRS